MNKEQYKKIRKAPNFLYVYFLDVGGKVKSETDFDEALKLWIFQQGTFPPIGIKRIENYLDSKWT